MISALNFCHNRALMKWINSFHIICFSVLVSFSTHPMKGALCKELNIYYACVSVHCISFTRYSLKMIVKLLIMCHLSLIIQTYSHAHWFGWWKVTVSLSSLCALRVTVLDACRTGSEALCINDKISHSCESVNIWATNRTEHDFVSMTS